ncbi:MAG: universal stress protein [Thermoplasmatales archaeon]|nr:universal stress protein [Thermoplasmatales archaeon]
MSRELSIMTEISRVVIPVDKSEASKIAVEQGSHIAKLLGVDVAIISIDDSQQFIASASLENKLKKEHELSLEEFKKTVESREVNATTEIIVGLAPAQEIVKYVKDDDLIIMASHSKKGIDKFILGSVSEEVVHRVNCHVMILKPQLIEGK